MVYIPLTTELPALHCKPSHTGLLFNKDIPQGNLAIRSLNMKEDLDTLYKWVNQDYAKKFWQMDGSREVLSTTYSMVIESLHAHSFMVLLDGRPVGQVDCYQVLSDELKNHVEANPEDCGIHILMLPPKHSARGLALEALKGFVEFYFSFSLSKKLYGEPDKDNLLANLLARKVGFQYLKEVTLSYKTANLYLITR